MLSRLSILVFLMVAGSPLRAEVVPMDISADYCSILRAFSLADTSSCPPVKAGLMRGLGTQSRDAIPPGGLEEERGYFIRFAFNSKDLSPEYTSHLTRLGQVFHAPETAALCFKLVGHTDAAGSAKYNQTLSEQRARTVHLFLIGVSGVSPDRLSLEGRGERQPLPGIESGHGLNRRVEILARPMTGSTCDG